MRDSNDGRFIAPRPRPEPRHWCKTKCACITMFFLFVLFFSLIFWVWGHETDVWCGHNKGKNIKRGPTEKRWNGTVASHPPQSTRQPLSWSQHHPPSPPQTHTIRNSRWTKTKNSQNINVCAANNRKWKSTSMQAVYWRCRCQSPKTKTKTKKKLEEVYCFVIRFCYFVDIVFGYRYM